MLGNRRDKKLRNQIHDSPDSWVNFYASLIAFSSFIALGGREFEYDVVDNYGPQDELDVEGVILMMAIKSSYLWPNTFQVAILLYDFYIYT